MKHHEFIERVRQKSQILAHHHACLVQTLALQIDPDSLPDDLDAAADRLVQLISQVKRELPA